ncbi:MAG: TolC family protein [Verrucomicrobia bacterium]|nr:TolC family protein [Verrucomicrobiota bacterium]
MKQQPDDDRMGGFGRTRVARPLCTLLALLAGIGVARSQASAVGADLPLVAAVDLAVRENAGLKSLRAQWEAMRERPAQAGALPNPMAGYSGMDLASGGAWPDTGERRFMVQQEFPWFGKRGLREGIAVKDAEVMERELEAMVRDVVMKVKESYSDLAAVQRVLAITREEEGVIRRMEKVAETMYAAGERAQVDVLKAQSEITMLRQKLLDFETRENRLAATLNTLLNRRADTPLNAAMTPPETGFGGNDAALFAIAATNLPEVLAAQAQVERYELERKLMAKEFVPDYKLGLEYRNLGASDDMVMFTVSVDLPVWRSKIRAGVREAEKMRASSQAAREAAQRQGALDARDASFHLKTARRTLELYRTELIPQAEARLNASDAGYRTGKVDFMDLLESERFLLDAKIMAAMAEGAIGMQAARLERVMGLDPGHGPAAAKTE